MTRFQVQRQDEETSLDGTPLWAIRDERHGDYPMRDETYQIVSQVAHVANGLGGGGCVGECIEIGRSLAQRV